MGGPTASGRQLVRAAWVNATLAFVLELAALALLAVWGWRTGDGVLRWVLAVGLPLVAAVLWGLFAAPRATRGGRAGRPVVQLLVLGGAALALAALAGPVAGAVLAVVVVLNLVLAVVLPPVGPAAGARPAGGVPGAD